MQSVGKILKRFDPTKDKYISRDFQAFGIYLSEEMNDYKHRGMWIKLAKTNHRALLEKALSFVKDSTADNKIGLFLWKLKQIKNEKNNTK
ncbi:MAG: hypothetical protein COU25_03070 [Candidatus Levybacteria bacterium CG10_big_fil_rev_8_21_14_0_10_35_13]|nr:MAG: hypothetical protein COU25_03070 [Candidatus Levybacteria bacterium CG10_big_fil_rev_8_21_14_0_10_35_13]